MEKLVKELINKFKEKDIKIVVAESCTGGLLSSTLTLLPGSSDVFLYGIVCYSNCSKKKFLNVKDKTLNTWGAVSKETVKEMLEGLTSLVSEKSFAIAVSGVAGPRESEKKPVGKVFIGVSAAFCNISFVEEFDFGRKDRHKIQEQTVEEAIRLCLLESSGII
jgi:PncC family amidohydrolase